MSDWYCSSAAYTAIAQFAASTAYVVGNIVRPLTAPAYGSRYVFRCTTAWTSATEPAWPTANNSTVTTGGATFTNVTGQSTYGWSAAGGDVFTMTGTGGNARLVANGDRLFVSSDHTETNAATITLTLGYLGGTVTGVCQAISVNRAGSVPPVGGDYLDAQIGPVVTA